jgi:mevalonate kinase
MPAISASAPGKAILFGEHAVVYGQPAIAVPVMQVQAKAIVTPNVKGQLGEIHIQAPAIDLQSPIRDLPLDDALRKAVSDTIAELGLERPPAFDLRVTSTIPLAAGLGSGAAVSVAVIRAVAEFLGRKLPDETVSALAFEIEKIHHGTPSGIDNTVVTYARPVYFIKGQPLETFTVSQPFTIVIADTGVPSPTGVAVGDVRTGWQAEPEKYEALFSAIGEIARQARAIIASGHPDNLGLLMDENHRLLADMGVSSPELDRLVAAAREAGALGAKLSGGGRGGNMIALVQPRDAESIANALLAAGVVNAIITSVGK